MKFKKGFRLRPLGKEFIVVGEDVEQVNFNRMIALNQSAAYLWRSVDGKDFTVEDLCELLLDEYEVDEATALADSKAIAAKWIEAGVIEQ